VKKLLEALKATAHYVLALGTGLVAGGIVSAGAYFIGGVTAPIIGAIVGSFGSFGMIAKFARSYKTSLPRGTAAGCTTAFALCVVGNCAAGIYQDNKLWKEELTGGNDITRTFNDVHRPQSTIKKPSTGSSHRPQPRN